VKLLSKRHRTTKDGIFSALSIDTNPFTCFIAENLEHAIPKGIYKVCITYSPRLKMETPHLSVPSRDAIAPGKDAGIRVHPANFPYQLEGCLAPGETEEENAVTNSRATYAKLFDILKAEKEISIEIL
jgi:hypothetical protein